MTLKQRLARIRRWFRYDCPGMCCDCGKVGSGIPLEDGE